MPAKPIDVVALSETIDIPALFTTTEDQHIRLLRPAEVTDPASVEYAFAWIPPADAFQTFPNIRMVSSIAAGVDNILACPTLTDNVMVCRIRDDEQARLMAEFAAWNVIWFHRRMGDYLRAQRAHYWERDFRPRAFSDVTVGVLGFGLMGRACARLVAAMGFPVLAARNSGGTETDIAGVTVLAGPEAVNQVAQRSDILINVLPLTDSTRDMLNLSFFRQMPRGAALIQLGRGEHMIEEDLLTALDEGTLSGAAVDVLRQEPPAPDHPYWDRADIVLTPHKASDPSRAEALRQLEQNVLAHAAGQPVPGEVNKSAGY